MYVEAILRHFYRTFFKNNRTYINKLVALVLSSR